MPYNFKISNTAGIPGTILRYHIMVSQLDEYKQALCKLGADSISGHRRRRWPNIKTTLCQCLVFAGTKAQCHHWTHVLWTECTTHSDTTVLIYDT